MLLTGAAGFVGRHMIQELLRHGYEVISLDAVPADAPGAAGLPAYHQVDLRERDAVHALMADVKPDAVIHLAAISFVPDGNRDPQLLLGVNIGGTIDLTDAVRAECPEARILFVSSAQVYGTATAATAEFPLREDSPLLPLSPYAVSKVAGERFLQACAASPDSRTDGQNSAETLPKNSPEQRRETRKAFLRELKNSREWKNRAFVCAVVPPLSSCRHLPDELPPDGRYEDRLSIVMTPNEIGHAAFLLLPFRRESGVNISVSPLRGKSTSIPASALDLRIVKYWYQDGTAWCSYFADPLQQELVPELLLHDENLIRVDHERKYNYLRVGDSWQWISYPEGIRYGWFNYVKAPVRDAGKLAAFSLDPEENKKFFLTVRLPDGTLPGNYEGTLKIHRAGRELGILKVALRVLPFELPDPRTWYDIGKKFYTSIYMPPLCEEFRMADGDYELRVALPESLAPEIVEKGSIAIDGVSLTVVDVGKSDFSVCLIPVTRNDTALVARTPGTLVNLEGDLVGKYIRRQFELRMEGAAAAPAPSGITMDTLREAGFL